MSWNAFFMLNIMRSRQWYWKKKFISYCANENRVYYNLERFYGAGWKDKNLTDSSTTKIEELNQF